jgi:hypothetical protein
VRRSLSEGGSGRADGDRSTAAVRPAGEVDGDDQLACLLAGADPPAAVAGGPAAALVDAVAGAEAVGDAGEGVLLALPGAHPRLHRHHPADVAAAAVCREERQQARSGFRIHQQQR